MEMIDNRKERAMILVLNQAEPEAIPLQRIRSRQYEIAPFVLGQLAMLNRSKLNVAGVGDFMPNDVVGVFVFEPAPVGFVAAYVGVDDVRHGADVALSGYLPGAHDQPRIIKPALLVFNVATQMTGLHGAGRRVNYWRLPRFRNRG